MGLVRVVFMVYYERVYYKKSDVGAELTVVAINKIVRKV